MSAAERDRAYAEGFRDARAAASAIVVGYTDGDSQFDSTIARIADDIERLRGLEPIKPGIERMTGLCTDKAPCAIATELRRQLTEGASESERLKRLHSDAFHEAERWKEREAEALRALSDGAKWVSTEQRKPEDGQTVLAYWATVGHCPASYESLTYHASDAPDSRECWSDVFGSDDDEPTHWMPLPEAPK